MKWRLQSTGRIYDAGEGQVVYFHTASGDTHLLGEFAAHLLELFGEGPRDLAQLLDEVAVTGDGTTPPEDTVRSVVDELVGLDILGRTE